jgi:glycosyltransferase involved in cell wall biosynthesis
MQLVEAAARVIHKYPGLGVVILGDGAGVQDLERRAHELDISENCVFPGYVPFHQVPTYVNSLDLGVSLNLLESREASSELKVRQYLACGKPVVASPGGNDFLVSAGLGSIVPPNDIDLIAQAIDRWLALNPQDRSDFAEKASTYTACNLSVDSATDQRLELWTERLQSLAPQLS